MPKEAPRIWIILVAGGSGIRFGSPKQFETLCGKSVLEWSIETAQFVTPNLVVVLPEDGSTPPDFKNLCKKLNKTNLSTITGGGTRSASVRAGLQQIGLNNPTPPKEATKIAEPNEIVLIHDAVRPLASKELFWDTIQAVLDGADAAAPAIAPTDTIHTTKYEILDRQNLLSLQTPQAFKAEVLKEIHESKPESTDDISLCILAQKKVAYVKGNPQNLKITMPHDLLIAESLLNAVGHNRDNPE